MDNGRLTTAERTELLALARRTLRQRLNDSPLDAFEVADLPGLQQARGAFVTLTLAGNLRGCIGNFLGQKPLWKMVQSLAISAALHDPRFPPLRAPELDVIEIEISVLTPLRVITDTAEIRVGTHGLYITQGHATGVLLPQVAVEYGWSRNEFLRQTCRKAGLPATAWQHGATIEIFSAEVFSESELDGGKVSCA
jgi:AmmeMemoRadiSam system protein A